MARISNRARRKKVRRKRAVRILVVITALILLTTIISQYVMLFMFLSTASTATSIDWDELFTPEEYKVNIGSSAPVLVGGIDAMGADFELVNDSLQTAYNNAQTDADKNVIKGKILYAQILQLLNAQTELTGYPMLLFATALGIRESNIMSPSAGGNYGNIGVYTAGDISGGIFTTYFAHQINGLNEGGGVIRHSYDNRDSEDLTAVPTIIAKDYTTGVEKELYIKYNGTSNNATLNDMKTSDGLAITYNKGAFGPLQLEGNHWNVFVAPYVRGGTHYSNTEIVYGGTAYYNIPFDVTTYDSVQSAQAYCPSPRGIVTDKKSQVKLFKNNKEFSDLVCEKLGHPNYIEEYKNVALTDEVFKADTYVFKDRFQNSDTTWDDYVLALESYVQAYNLLACDRIARYPMKGNSLGIKNELGEVRTEFDSLLDFEDGGTLKNDTAVDIYWTLCMLQSWNFGNVPSNYSGSKDSTALSNISLATAYNIKFFYRELANYISENGTSKIREHADNAALGCNPSHTGKCPCCNGPISHMSGDTTHAQAAGKIYRNLAELVFTENGTKYVQGGGTNETTYAYKTVMTLFDLADKPVEFKNAWAYAVTALLDADEALKFYMLDLYGIQEFNIFNYGADLSLLASSTIYVPDTALKTQEDVVRYLYSVQTGTPTTIYFYGASGEIIDISAYDYYTRTYSNDYPTFSESSGKRGYDCSGLFKQIAGFRTSANTFMTEHCIDLATGTNQWYKASDFSIPWDSGQVIMLFRLDSDGKAEHCGIYITGNVYVHSWTQVDKVVLGSGVRNSGYDFWTAWGYPDWIDYSVQFDRNALPDNIKRYYWNDSN